MQAAPTSRTGTASVANGTVEYEVLGSGPAVILIHGGLVDRRLWDGQVPKLADRYRVVRYDLRGFGRSSAPPGSFSHVEDLDVLLRELRVSQAVLVGLSLGSMVAMDYTLEHPERVQALVLAAPGLRGWQPGPNPAIEAAYRAVAMDPEEGIALLLETGLGAVQPRARELLHRMCSDNLRGWAQLDPQDVRWPSPPTAERLQYIGVPTLIVVGARDEPDVLAIAGSLSRKVPRNSLVVLPEAKHHPNLDQPEEFNRQLEAFLRAHAKE